MIWSSTRISTTIISPTTISSTNPGFSSTTGRPPPARPAGNPPDHWYRGGVWGGMDRRSCDREEPLFSPEQPRMVALHGETGRRIPVGRGVRIRKGADTHHRCPGPFRWIQLHVLSPVRGDLRYKISRGCLSLYVGVRHDQEASVENETATENLAGRRSIGCHIKI